MSTPPPSDPLTALRGASPVRAYSVRDLATFAQTAGCDLASLAFAARVDMDGLLGGTAHQAPFGQSPFAMQRGNMFERRIGADAGFAPLLTLLREELGFAPTEVRVRDLRQMAGADRDRSKRANATRAALRDMLSDDPAADNLIAGAVLEYPILGRTVRFEADALAFQVGGVLRVLEIKSFPTVDRKCDPNKAGAAFDQTATYIVVLRDVVRSMGADPGRISTEALLVTPKNVGLTPVLHRHEVAARVRRIERVLGEVPKVAGLVSRVPAGASFAAAADEASPEQDRVAAFGTLADKVGTRYTPDCLQSCGAARLCRARAVASGDPALCGSRSVRELPGVTSLARAGELADGAPASSGEAAAAAKLARAARAFDRARGAA